MKGYCERIWNRRILVQAFVRIAVSARNDMPVSNEVVLSGYVDREAGGCGKSDSFKEWLNAERGCRQRIYASNLSRSHNGKSGAIGIDSLFAAHDACLC